MESAQFEREFAERSGITVTKLRSLGRIVAPCHCGSDDCQGWQSIRRTYLADALEAQRSYVMDLSPDERTRWISALTEVRTTVENDMGDRRSHPEDAIRIIDELLNELRTAI